jgi:chemotaxis protein CheD
MGKDYQEFITTSYYDREFNTNAVKILPGQYSATTDGTAIVTLLGSCVSVCLYDEERGVGGMNHFMLPTAQEKPDGGGCTDPYGPPCTNPCSARYGKCALKRLLERLESLGARRDKLKAKLFGAGRVMAGGADIGSKNATFALQYLKTRGIPVVASDMGDRYPRKLIFFPATGRAFVKRLDKEPEGTVK